MQALGDERISAPLWLLTCGAVAAGAGEVTAPVQAQVWGLGRVAGLEHPDRWGGLIDLPPALDERAAGRLCGVLVGGGEDQGGEDQGREDQVAIGSTGILARRLTRAPLPGDTSDTSEAWAPRGSVLVTGGTGAIGGHAVRWLAQRGAARIILASRSGPAAPGAAALAAALAVAGATAELIAGDVANRDEVAGLLARTAADGPPLTAVLHTAGVVDDGVLDRLDTARLAAVLAPKATAAVYLDELTEGLNLDAFVLFSSAAATFGGAGQGNYAAANAFLDALAQHRRARGLPATSVAWGPWAGGGLAQASQAVRQRVRRGALPAMEPALALTALGQILAGRDAALTVMDVDWAQFAAAPGAGQSPLLRDLPEIRQYARALDAGTGAGPDRGELARQLAGLSPAGQARMLTELVRTQAATVLGHPSADAVGAGRAFSDLGFDSLTAVELRNRLAAATGLRLPATLVFDYPTSAALADYLRAEIQPAGTAPVFADLDQLESALSGIPIGSDICADITVRLQTVLSKWISAQGAPQANAVASKLQSATADEVFSFIDKELGVS